MEQHRQRLQFSFWQAVLKGGLLFLILAGLILGTGLPLGAATGPTLSGKLTGPEWRQADPEAKQDFCRKAFQAFRASPSQSYIISSNVTTRSPSTRRPILPHCCFQTYPWSSLDPCGALGLLGTKAAGEDLGPALNSLAGSRQA